MPQESWTSLLPLDIISQTAFFSCLSGGQLEAINELACFQHYPGGHQIYSIGEPANSLYVLVGGMVKFAIGRGTQNASAGEILRRGQVFGWAALTPNAKMRVATASCLTASTVLEIDGARLTALMDADAEMGYCIMKQLTILITGTFTEFMAG